MSCEHCCRDMISYETHSKIVAEQSKTIERLCVACFILILALLISNLFWLIGTRSVTPEDIDTITAALISSAAFVIGR